MNNLEFINKAIKIHLNKYDYSRVECNTLKQPVEIICKIHGLFSQRPAVHLRGSGCFKCYLDRVRKPLRDFINEAHKVHDNKYDYSVTAYKDCMSNIKILCPKHGCFKCTPNNHLSKRRGCPRCSNNVSKNEVLWLNKLAVPIKQYKLEISGIKYKIDGFDPDTNTIYEFLGDYWHGNLVKFPADYINKRCKKSMKELYDATMKRIDIFKNAGYNVVYIWESEFK